MTGKGTPGRIRRLTLAIGRASIWHPNAIPASEGELARDVKRWVLPVLDVVLIAAALIGLHAGMPSFAVVYSEAVSDVAGAALLVLATACLVGVAFPKLWALEFAAKYGLVAVLLTYAGLLFGLAVLTESARGFVAGITLAVTVLPFWRLVWLGREQRRRRADRARARARALQLAAEAHQRGSRS